MATVKELGAAIASHPQKVTAVFLGFDLWFDVLATGKVETLALFREGLTNRPMAGYALGMVVLSFFAQVNKGT